MMGWGVGVRVLREERESETIRERNQKKRQRRKEGKEMKNW